jgi:para-nitrobenzyl esterase
VVFVASCRSASGPSPASVAGHASPPPTIVVTDSGPLVGTTVEAGIRAFLGIPYAAPPTGDRRWRPPAPPAPWTTPRAAIHVGPACPQLTAPPYATTNEDCLSLNVWMPPGGSPRKPVFVWIPGGAFVEGSGGYHLYEGAHLAAREDAVVVTINYRVGALGFLSHAQLAREAGAQANPSFGLLDQQAALRWVQRNIAAFGGDPNLVTIFGQSAGAFSVCAHLAMPHSRGLFARAIMQSGACADPLYFGPREAEEQGAALARAVGCDDLPCLRRAAADHILRALPFKKGYVFSPGVWWGPVVDGTVLPLVPLEALRRRQYAHVPLLLGWNRDEGTMHTLGATAVAREEQDSFVRDAFGPEAVGPVAARYHAADSKAAFDAMMVDGAFACEARRVAHVLAAQDQPVFLYEFTHALDSPLHGLGATHSAELPLVFGTAEGVFRVSPREEWLSRLMMDAWGRFARTGDPSGQDLPWPRYTAENDTLAVLDLQPTVARGVKAEACDFWDTFERRVR